MFESVLAFWFGDDESTQQDVDARNQRWFSVDPAFDAEIRRRFGGLVDAARAGELDGWAASPRSWLALLLLLDQFPRNLHRGSPDAFAGDLKAQDLAVAGIARGDDRQLPPLWRAFAYLPLEHAENLALQERCVQLFSALAAEADALPAQAFAMYLDYAQRHREVIRRFGRFPHRNTALGRQISAEEQAYLAAGGGF
jgi:uncharacterized protein (DUF924 family)